MEDFEKARKAAETMVSFGESLSGIYKPQNKKQIMKVLARMKSQQMDISNALITAMKGLDLNKLQQTSTALDGIASSISNSVTEAITRINAQNEGIFNQWRNLGSKIQPTLAPSNFDKLQNVLQELSIQVATASITAQDLKPLGQVENIILETGELNEKIIENKYATTQDIQRLENLILIVLKSSIPKASKKGVLTFLFMLLSYMFEFLEHVWTPSEIYLAYKDQTKPFGDQPATKNDLENLKIELINTIGKSQHLIMITTSNCRVYHNPKNKSGVIETLPENTIVFVIGKAKKWAQINFKSLDDGLPDTGWCLKKYLARQK